MKHLLRLLCRKLGIRVFRRSTIPRGIDREVDLRRILGSGTDFCFFDVGANEGQTSLCLLREFSEATIHAFEPIPSTYKALIENTAGKGVRTYMIALGSYDGDATMRISPDSGSNRVVDMAISPQIDVGTPSLVNVPMQRLDSFCAERSIQRINLLKVDCEGHDLQVLIGGERLFAGGAIDAVYCEANLNRNLRHADFFEVENWLRHRDFVFYAFYDYSGWQYDISTEGFTNALFLRRELCSQHRSAR